MNLILLGVLCALFATSFAVNKEVSGGHCLNTIHSACSTHGELLKDMAKNGTLCRSAFGGFPQLSDRTQTLVENHMRASMQYLLIGTHFNEWDIQRPGFHNYFIKLSDDLFQDAITLIQHMVKRGGRLTNFTVPMPENERYQLGELEALSKALDIEKSLAARKLNMVHASTHGDAKANQLADGEFAHFLADQVSDINAPRITILANHANTLTRALTDNWQNNDPSLILHIYDTQVLK